jgi:hypothetical protein
MNEMDLLKDSQQLLKDLEGLDSALHLEVIVGHAAAFGRRCVEHGERVNSLVALFPGGVGFRQTGFASAEEKKEVFGQAANYLAQRGARLAVLIADTWVGSPGWKDRPSDDPNRTEALLVQAVTPNGKVVYGWICSHTRKGSRIEWCEAREGPIHDGDRQGLLRPWVVTIQGMTCGHVIPTKADGDNVRIFPPIDEDGNASIGERN